MNAGIDPFVDGISLQMEHHLFYTQIPDFDRILKNEPVDVSVF
jgi:hypothetical protein